MVTINEKEKFTDHASRIGFLDFSKLAINWEKNNDITSHLHDVIAKFFWRYDVSLVKCSYWSKYFNKYIAKHCCGLKEDRFGFLFFAFFKHRLSVSLFPVSRKCSKFWTNFRNCENSFNYSVAKYFHHTNINHIAIMSFIKVKSLDNSFNAILFESNIWLILICNGITRWRQSTMIFTEHYFRKKELMMGFFIKICNKFVILNKRQNARKCFVI